ncbi:HYR domain-containing protein [Flavobacterium aquidurense]|uniref:HYR domain-containing protein n=1 Tax=Flavobacterium aquidurense TaxID=362413 RepID=UPI0028604674|nr:HYR domain-containing protein [Flavobacterium aquidurense]MDR7371775.1 gliding motility-associated-like protein [Flavobacterium aquidurense]
MKTELKKFNGFNLKSKIILQSWILLLTLMMQNTISAQCTPIGFGDNVWNVAVYNAGDGYGGSGAWKDNYIGYYTDTRLSFSTEDRWSKVSTPSAANGTSGSPFVSCVGHGTTSNDYFSFSYKRKGFPSGTYSISMPEHDDTAILLIDGKEVWRHGGYDFGGTLHRDVWKGNLSATTTIELKTDEDVGDAFAQLTFTLIDPLSVLRVTANNIGAYNQGSIDVSGVLNGQINILSTGFGTLPNGSGVVGNASIVDETLSLTRNTNNAKGSWGFKPSIQPNSFEVAYAQYMGGQGTCAADGISFNYGNFDYTDNQGDAFGRTNEGLSVSFNDNGSTANWGISVWYKGVQVGNSYRGAPGASITNAFLATGTWVPVSITINSEGQLTLMHNNVLIFKNLQLPSNYLTDNKSSWQYAFSSSTSSGTATNCAEYHAVDNLRVTATGYLEYSTDQSSWQTSTHLIRPAGTYQVYARQIGTTNAFSVGLPVTIGTMSNPGNGLNFDGVDDFAAATGTIKTPNIFTFEAWFKTTGTNGGIVGFNDGVNAYYWSKFVYMNAGKVKFAVWNGTGQILTSTKTYNDGRYHHVAATFDGRTMNLYMDGVLDKTMAITKDSENFDGVLKIGGFKDWTNGNGTTNPAPAYDFFKGTIDEVKVWNTVRTKSQIVNGMFAEIDPAAQIAGNLLGYYRFNASTGNILTDLSGNGFHAILNNMTLSGTTSNWVESYAMISPQALSTTDIIPTGFTANWTAPAIGTADNYVLEVAKDAAFTNLLPGYTNKNVGPVTSSVITGLTPGTVYYWRVRANKGASAVVNQGFYALNADNLANYVTVNTAPSPINITSTTTSTTFNLLTNTGTVVDPNISVATDINITGFNVVISDGMQNGDVLSCSGITFPYNGIAAPTYDSTKGMLLFTGSATAANWQTVLRNVKFMGYKNGIGNRTITFSAGSLPSFNGHFYEVVNAGANITWTNAKTAAELRSALNCKGYLATPTTAAENVFLKQILTPQSAWIGASDAYSVINACSTKAYYLSQTYSEGRWYWVTGPEAGTQFAQSNYPSVAATGQYNGSWAPNEPNNSTSNGTTENFAGYYSNTFGTWNDFTDSNTYVNYYIVEYGGLSTDPVQKLTNSVNLNVTAAEPGNALSFDGSGDYVTMPRNPQDDFTIEFWMKTTQAGAAAGKLWHEASGIIGSEISGVTNDFGIGIVNKKISFGVGNPEYTLYSNADVNTGRWVHVAITRAKTSGLMQIYINGVLDASYTQGNHNSLNASASLYLGTILGAAPANFYNGLLDEVRIWNYVRSTQEIQANYKSLVPNNAADATNPTTKYLINYYSFNQGVSGAANPGNTILYDQTTTKSNGTLTGFALNGATSNWEESFAMVVPATIPATKTYSLGFTANWTSSVVGKADNYLLDVSTDPNFGTFISGYNGKNIGNVTSYDVNTALAVNTTYYYRVRSDKSTVTVVANTGQYSNVTSIKTGTTETLVATEASDRTSTSFVANWSNPPLHNIQSYTLEVATDNAFTHPVTGSPFTVSGTSKELTGAANGILANTFYYYRVKATGYNDSNIITTSTNAPFATITTSANTIVCKDDTVLPVITFTGSGSARPYTFEYTINGGTSKTVSTTSDSDTVDVTVPTGTDGKFVYALVRITDSNSPTPGTNLQSGNKTIIVNPLPTVSLTAQTELDSQATIVCAETDVTYTTEAGQNNYIWSVQGTAGVDYTIISGGTSLLDNTVTLKWMTAGDKTVTVKYTDTVNGCLATIPATTTVTVTALPVVTPITGPSEVSQGFNAHLQNNTPGGIWSTSDQGIAPISPDGTITGVDLGTAIISYTVNTGGCPKTVTHSITVEEALPPAIVSFTPAMGLAGNTITLAGTNLSGATEVLINGIPTAFTVDSKNSITITVPNGTGAGKIEVTTPAGTAVSSTDFTFIVLTSAPVITSFNPVNICQGGNVIISGINLTDATAVKLGGTLATNFTVDSDTQITVNGITGSSGDVEVTTAGGTALAPGFILDLPSVAGSISGEATVCAGKNSTVLTLNDYRGSIQWQSSSDNITFADISGETASTYTATNLTATTYYKAVVSSGVCIDTTNPVTITVSPAVVAGTITGGGTVCNGTNSTILTLDGNDGEIQWQSSTDGNTFTDISGENSTTYTAVNLTETTYYRAVVGNGNCFSNTPVKTISIETTPPTVVTKNITVYLNDSGTASILPADIDNNSTGSCGIAKRSLDISDFNCSNKGANTVTLTITDLGGNTATKTAIVTVVDNIKPTITAPAALRMNVTSGCEATGVALGTPVRADNCSVASVSNNAPTTFPIGDTTVTWTVTDESGNTATATQIVTITDNILPTITAPAAVSVNVTSGCEAIGVALGTPVTADNCSVASVENNAPTSFPIGDTTVTWTVTDGAGNTASATQIVTVVDNIKPTIIAPAAVGVNITLGCEVSGVALGTPVTADNCSVASVDNNAPGVFPIGNTTVTWTITDGSGNTATATQIVTVTDNILPTVSTKNVTVSLDATGKLSITAADINNNSTDNCEIASMSVSPSNFTCSNKGVNTVTLTVTDVNGNIATGTATVTIIDDILPIVSTKDITVSLDATGNVSIVAGDINNNSTDNCEIASMSIDKNSFSCADKGANTVKLTVTDVNGNTATNTATVTVVDSIMPTVLTKDISVSLDATGNVSIAAADIDNNSTDNCGIATMSVYPNLFSCANIGVNTVTLTVKDQSGNTATKTAIVTVSDTTLPTITAPAPVSVNVTSGCRASGVSLGTPVTSDNCSVALVINNAPTTFPIGNTTVTWTVSDKNGNTATATQIVTVVDNIKPTITAPAAVHVNVTSGCEAAGVALGTPVTADNCSVASVVNDAPTIFPIGNTTITWTVTDRSGNTATATQTVTVVDKIKPTITAPPAISIDALSGCEATGVVLGTPITADNCSISSVVNDAPATFPIGNTTVTWTVTDASDNKETATQIVTVTDNILPTITAPATVSVNVTSGCEAIGLNLGTPVTSDNCSGSTVTNNAPATFPIGNTTVTWTVTDKSGNKATATQMVTVSDTILPTITAPATVNVNVTSGCEATGVNLGTPVTSDNCSGSKVINNAPATFPIGNTTVTWTVTDKSGNTATATQTVTVVDNIKPSITAPAGVSIEAISDCEATGVVLGTPVTSDNCSVTSVVNDAPATFSIGKTIVTWTVTDASGNKATATQMVTVVDNIKPTITAPAAVSMDIASGCRASGVSLGTPVTSDNCSVALVVNNAPTTFPIGNTTVTWTVSDKNGNTATATQIVTIVDNIKPNIKAPATVQVNVTSGCEAIGVALGTADTTDNCSGSSVMNNAPATFPIGNTTVIWTVTDRSGNTATATQIVTVVDNMKPSITAPAAVSTGVTSGSEASGVVLGTPVTADNCSVASVINDAPKTFPIGNTTVTWTVIDGSGNKATATQIVTVMDNTSSTIIAPPKVNVNLTSGCEASGVVLGTPVTANNFSVQSVVNDAPKSFPIGTTTVTWTVTDKEGNTAHATQLVEVRDLIVPTVLTKNITVFLDESGNATINEDDINNGSFDNCGNVSLKLSKKIFNCNDTNNDVATIVTVTLSATDKSGNTATAKANVTIVNNFGDNDNDHIKDNCDDDDDNDGILDVNDNFPLISNNTLVDTDHDGIDDSIDTDDDNDGIPDTEDNSPLIPNPDQKDRDNDGNGDVTDTIKVLPSEAITPNGDGINDTWVIHNIEKYPGTIVHVYNRLGQEVFNAKNYQNDWNGNKNEGRLLETGSYYYQIDLGGDDTIDLRGWLYITQ